GLRGPEGMAHRQCAREGDWAAAGHLELREAPARRNPETPLFEKARVGPFSAHIAPAFRSFDQPLAPVGDATHALDARERAERIEVAQAEAGRLQGRGG